VRLRSVMAICSLLLTFLVDCFVYWTQEGDVFLMASRKRPKNKTSNYLITMGKFVCCMV